MLKIIHDEKFGDIRFNNADSSIHNHFVVIVTFLYENKIIQRNISLIKCGYDDYVYVRQAIKIIKSEIKSGYLESYSIEYIKKVIRKRRLLLAFTILCIIVSIASIALLIWKIMKG